MGRYWVNGIPKKTVLLNNRALHFGDGFFTTAKLRNGKIEFLDWHIDRLVISAKRLMFDNVNFNLLHKEMLQAADSGNIYGVMKIIISRNNNNKLCGYRYDANIEPLRIISVSHLPNHYVCWINKGIRLKTSVVRLARDAFLSGIKHLNRLEQVMIAAWLNKNNMADEALVLDSDGNVVECCSANIFWRNDYQVFTPSLCHAGINGIVRQLVLKLLPELGYCIRKVIVGPEHLKNAHEVFVTNSLLPVASVKSIDNCLYSDTDRTLFHLLRYHIINNIIP